MKRIGAAGFTLIEVLVALFILAVVVVAGLQLFGGGLRLARASRDHVEATLLASAKLSELALQPLGELHEGTIEGSEGVYQWTQRVTAETTLLPPELTRFAEAATATVPAGTPEAGAPPTGTAKIRFVRLTVQVRWGQNRRVELVTLRGGFVKP